MTMTEQPTESAILGLGPSAPEHRDGRHLRGAYSDEPHADALQAADVREARLVHRLLRLGGEIPADRWQRIDAVIDRLLASDTLDPRDAIRISQVQSARERVIATATATLLNKIQPDKHEHHVSGDDVRLSVVQLHADPSYIEYLRQQAVARAKATAEPLGIPAP